MDRHKIAIVIPAYNESKTIKRVVSSVISYGNVIVVDDGSIDATAENAESAGAIVVQHDCNRGYDQALNSGFATAKKIAASKVITFDADGQHDASILKRFIKKLDFYPVVLGVRSEKPRFSEKLFAFYTDRFLGIKDPLCGMKGYQISVYDEQGFFDDCGSIGSQLSVFAVLNNKKIKQIPVPVYPRMDKPRFGNAFRANIKILKAFYKIFVKSFFVYKMKEMKSALLNEDRTP